MKKNKGFTLVEIIVVLVILGIMAAFVIPTMMGVINDVDDKRCLTNRSTLAKFLRQDLYLKSGIEKHFDVYKTEYKCPEGGELGLKYDYDTMTLEVTCSVHKDSASIWINKSMDAGGMEAIKNELGIRTYSKIDSTAPARSGGGKSQNKSIEDNLSAMGINLDDLGAHSWCTGNEPGNKYFCWTVENVEDMQLGDTVTVVKYSFDTDTYSVWEAKVGDSIELRDTDQEYNVIDMNSASETQQSRNLGSSEKSDLYRVLDLYEAIVDSKGRD